MENAMTTQQSKEENLLVERLTRIVGPLSSSSASSSAAASATSSTALALGFDSNTDTISSSDGGGEKVNKRTLFICNLDWSVHEYQLKRFLSKFGHVKRCKILRHFHSDLSKGRGYAEFYDEADAQKVLDAKREELVLYNRPLQIEYYKKIKSKKKITQKKSAADRDETLTETNAEASLGKTHETSSATINDLPYQLILNIFSQLCIRDLCIVERVCKKWYELARMTWSVKDQLILTDKTIYENFSKKDNMFGFECRPKFDFKAFNQIMNKNFGLKLKSLDLSNYSDKFGRDGSDCVKAISFKCWNLVSLNLSRLNFSNHTFVRLVKSCHKIKHIDLSGCSRITDSSVVKLFKYCPLVDEINLSFCYALTGHCFYETKGNLVSVAIDSCEKISDESLLHMLNKNKNVKYLSIKRSINLTTDTLLSIIRNSPKLETLLLSDSGFENLIGMENISFRNMQSLVHLELDGTNGDNRIFSKVLNECNNLKTFNIGNCIRVSDETFTLAEINAPLEELNVNFLKELTDLTLEKLSQVSRTLQRLKIKGCMNLSNEGIARAVEKFPNLNYLDVRFNERVDNLLLETALSLEGRRKIYILCSDTNVDATKFVFTYEHTKQQLLDHMIYLFKYKNLTFESFKTNKLKSVNNKEAVWGENDAGGFYYIGPSSDEDDFVYAPNDPNTQNFNHHHQHYQPMYANYDDDDDDHDEDDFDDFINNEETEMYNELDV